METIELKSGARLGLAVAPFSSANKLRKVIQSELLAVQIDVDIKKLLALKGQAELTTVDSATLNTLKNVLCRLMSSETIEAAFFECAARCTLDSKKITRDLFDEEKYRPEFFEIAGEVIKLNVAPFFESLLSLLSPRPGAEEKSQT